MGGGVEIDEEKVKQDGEICCSDGCKADLGRRMVFYPLARALGF